MSSKGAASRNDQKTRPFIAKWDVFICHAGEDKEQVARPLANVLTRIGVKVWYDEFTVSLGDSLRRKIDSGLAQSRYGVVILSPDFFKKEWPQKELDGLTGREGNGEKVILPVWHNVTQADIARVSPLLADRVAVSTNQGIEFVAEKILEELRKVSSRILPKGPVIEVPPKPIRPARRFLPAVIGAILFLIFLIVLSLKDSLILISQGLRTKMNEGRVTETEKAKLGQGENLREKSPLSILASFAAPGRSAQGITLDGSDLWVSDNSGTIFQVDFSGKTKGAFQAPEVTPEGIAWDGASFWVFTTNYGDIVQFRVKPGERTVTKVSSFRSPNQTIGGTNDGLAWDGKNLWYADQFNVYKLDSSGAVLGKFTLRKEIAGLTWSGANLWVAHNDFPSPATLSAVDTMGNVLASYSSPISQIEGLSADGRDLWVIGRDSLRGKVVIYHLNMSNVEALTSAEKTPPTAKNN